MHFFIVVLASFVPAIFAQTCPISAVIGDCVMGLCPGANTCVAGKCCMNSELHPLPGGTCVDLKADCPRKRDLCVQTAYIGLMAEQCPRTCGKCRDSPPQPAPGCVDIASNCASTAKWCSNSEYLVLMTQQCPRTCGRCPVGKK